VVKDLEGLKQDLESGDVSKAWAAAAELGEYALDCPEKVWPLVIQFGSSSEEEMRQAIATCVLEHVLEYHFDEYFPLIEAEGSKGNLDFVDTLRLCWKFGKSLEPSRAKRWETFLSRYS
jgi:hypothetical protein